MRHNKSFIAFEQKKVKGPGIGATSFSVSYPSETGSSVRGLGSDPKTPNTVVALDYASGQRLWALQVPKWLPVGGAVSPTPPF
jgi:hypothetical protein